MNDVEVRQNATEHRYEAWADGALVGVLVYQVDGDTVSLVHTEVDQRAEGRGVGSALARRALDDVRAAGRSAVPLCPFVHSWIGRHPQYAELVHRP